MKSCVNNDRRLIIVLSSRWKQIRIIIITKIIRIWWSYCSAVSHLFCFGFFSYLKMLKYIYTSWCYFLWLLRPCCRLQTIWNFLSHQYSFDYIRWMSKCACVSMVMKSFVNREREKKKLILSFRVSRCQGVMFYLKRK